jgi:hypothetical protein
VRGVLHSAFAENVQMPLERDDPVRVSSSRAEGCAALPPDDLVDAVEGGERADLDTTSSGRGSNTSEGGKSMQCHHPHAYEATLGGLAAQCG